MGNKNKDFSHFFSLPMRAELREARARSSRSSEDAFSSSILSSTPTSPPLCESTREDHHKYYLHQQLIHQQLLQQNQLQQLHQHPRKVPMNAAEYSMVSGSSSNNSNSINTSSTGRVRSPPQELNENIRNATSTSGSITSNNVFFSIFSAPAQTISSATASSATTAAAAVADDEDTVTASEGDDSIVFIANVSASSASQQGPTVSVSIAPTSAVAADAAIDAAVSAVASAATAASPTPSSSPLPSQHSPLLSQSNLLSDSLFAAVEGELLTDDRMDLAELGPELSFEGRVAAAAEDADITVNADEAAAADAAAAMATPETATPANAQPEKNNGNLLVFTVFYFSFILLQKKFIQVYFLFLQITEEVNNNTMKICLLFFNSQVNK